jgi:hypothetical protein
MGWFLTDGLRFLTRSENAVGVPKCTEGARGWSGGKRSGWLLGISREQRAQKVLLGLARHGIKEVLKVLGELSLRGVERRGVDQVVGFAGASEFMHFMKVERFHGSFFGSDV